MSTQKHRRKPKSEPMPVEKARAALKELLNAAEFRGERTVITRYGQPSAAVVSIADLEKLEGAA